MGLGKDVVRHDGGVVQNVPFCEGIRRLLSRNGIETMNGQNDDSAEEKLERREAVAPEY